MTTTSSKTQPVRSERRRSFDREPWTCSHCGIHLQLRSPHVSELPSEWQCSKCGCKRAGVYDATARDAIHHNVTRSSAAQRLIVARHDGESWISGC